MMASHFQCSMPVFRKMPLPQPDVCREIIQLIPRLVSSTSIKKLLGWRPSQVVYTLRPARSWSEITDGRWPDSRLPRPLIEETASCDLQACVEAIEDFMERDGCQELFLRPEKAQNLRS